MKIILKTRCGAKQEKELGLPLQKSIQIAMIRSWKPWEDEQPTIDKRMFDLFGFDDGVPVYHEREQQ